MRNPDSSTSPASSSPHRWADTWSSAAADRLRPHRADRQTGDRAAQRIRRKRHYEEFKDRVGEIIGSVVKRTEAGNLMVELGRAERCCGAMS
jgi:hypothetical protein